MKKGSKHSEATKIKIGLSGLGRKVIGRKMPPKTEEHKQKIRDTNKKTWSDPDRIIMSKISGAKSWNELTVFQRNKRIRKIKLALKKINYSERARETMLRLRQDPEWIKK